jgi:hypothetical protein
MRMKMNKFRNQIATLENKIKNLPYVTQSFKINSIIFIFNRNQFIRSI